MPIDIIARETADIASRRLRRTFPRTQPLPLVAFLGDSLTAFGSTSTATLSCWTAISYMNYLRRMMRGRLRTDRSLVFAVAGLGTAHLLSTQVPGAIAAGVDMAFIQVGTNDVGVLTAAQVVSNVTTAVQALNAAGIGVVLISVAPQSSWGPIKRQQAAEINRSYALLARNAAACRFIDINPVYVDYASGNAVAGYQYSDNVHDGPVGSLAKAQRIFSAVDDLFPKHAEWLPLSALADYDASLAPNGNFVTNGIMTGTGGTLAAFGGAAAPTGQIATNWYAQFATSTATTVTAALSKGTDATTPSLPTQIITMGGTGDGNFVRLITASVNGTKGITIPSGLAIGTPLVMEADISWSGLTNIAAVEVYLQLSDGSTTYAASDGGSMTPSGTSALPLPASFSGIFRTPPFAVPAGMTVLNGDIRVIPLTGQALGGSISISRVAVHIA